jgi:glycosyltransferase involved in cell wall biosynthesis
MRVTILIPVGPNYNKVWLREAVDSVLAQTYVIDEILVIADGVNVLLEDIVSTSAFISLTSYINGKRTYDTLGGNISIWDSPCNLGFVAAFNCGMALADNDLVIYLAADDRLEPMAVERAVQTYLDNDKKDAWYAFAYHTSEGDSSSIPINAALITKGLWEMVGGYPPAAFVGPDAALLSCLMVHAPDRIIRIDEGIPLYWIREHEDQETKTHTWKYVTEMNSIRDKLTRDFVLKEL